MGSNQSKSCSQFGSVGSFLVYDRIIYQLKPGDLIEIQRNRYKHWVICESIDSSGNVWCYHVTGVGEILEDNEELVHSTTNIHREIAFNGKAIIRYEPLEDILKDTDDRKPSLCRVNNQQIMASKMLKTVNNERPPLEAVFRMLSNRKDTYVKYDLKSMNCEHYCTLWKYGIGWSSQVNSFQDICITALKMMSSMAEMAGQIARQNGCYKLGLVCIVISTVASVAAKVVEGIEFTLNDLKIEQFLRQAIAH